MQNPDWHRDEIIIALDFYFSTNGGKIDASNPKVKEISDLLKKLPIFPIRANEEKFRNPNGVSLKLSNFKSFDPNYKGVGMKRGSKLDEKIFKEFFHKRNELHEIANQIKKIANNTSLKHKISHVEEDEQTQNDSVIEGLILYKLHKVRERDIKIAKRKKEDALSKFGYLACEACLFEFEKFYGQIGKGYIECHHRTPLASFKIDTRTTLNDLALVCSNCHRMLHRKIDTITVEDLKMMIHYDRI